MAHEASLAAKAQGKFWPMHDELFKNMKKLKRPDLEKYAQAVGLDMVKFKKALDDGTYKDQVTNDIKEGGEVQVRGTPSIFINGRKASGIQFDQLKPLFDEELKKAEKLLKAGTPLDKLYEKLTAKGKVFKILEDEVRKIDTTNAPFLGKKSARIAITEFSDFECPYCGRVGPALKKLVDLYPNDVKLVFKNFPLGFHKNAQKAAEAALAANAQGKFWEMHDIMFQNYKALTVPDLERYAAQVGLDVTKFKADLSSNKYKAQVRADFNEGRRAGVRGTPSIYINGRKYGGGRGVRDYVKLLEEEFGLKKAK